MTLLQSTLGWQTAFEQGHADEIGWHNLNHSTWSVKLLKSIHLKEIRISFFSSNMSPKRKYEDGCSPSKKPKTKVSRMPSCIKEGSCHWLETASMHLECNAACRRPLL